VKKKVNELLRFIFLAQNMPTYL